MSNCLSICLSNFVCLPLSVCLVVCLNLSTSLLTIYPSVYLNICPIVTCTSVRPSVRLSFCPCAGLFNCRLSICVSLPLVLSYCLFIVFCPCPFLCMSVSVFCLHLSPGPGGSASKRVGDWYCWLRLRWAENQSIASVKW